MKTWKINFLSIFLLSSFLHSKSVLCAEVNAQFQEVFKVDGIVWGFDFIADSHVVYSIKEKGYFLFDKKSKKHTQILEIKDVYVAGQGGYLDVKVHPQFESNKKVIFSYSKKWGKGSTTAVSIGTLEDNKVINVKEIVVANADTDEDIHFGGRMLFKNADIFYLSVGDRNERKDAQNLKRDNGKILEVNVNGQYKIHSYGHRNPQGLSYFQGELWEAEFGPRGGDELNKIVEGSNYGWPVVTMGKEYWGPKIGVKKKEGMVDPVLYWVPSISPSGLHCYKGEVTELKDKCFLATLSGSHIRVVDPKNNDKQYQLLNDLNYRFRQISQDVRNSIYVSTDEGHLGRLEVTPSKSVKLK